MSNTTDTSNLENLVSILVNNKDILEIYTARGVGVAQVNFFIVTGEEGGEPSGEIITHETAPDNDVLVITLNGKLNGDPGVTLDCPNKDNKDV